MSDNLADACQTGDSKDGSSRAQDCFGPGDLILFVGRQQREFMARLDPGTKIKLKGEYLDAEEFIGLPVGTSIVTPFKLAYLALRPTLDQRIMNMPRQAQIIYPKDLAIILFFSNIHPGSRVVEVGTGHGAMTMSLIRAVGPEGSVVSYEIRKEHARRTRNNVKRYLGETPWWRVVIADARESGLGDEPFDAAIVDMPTPWELASQVVEALKPGGVASFLLPNVPQVINLVEELKASGKFAHFQTMELMLRPWKIEGPSARPEMRISGHTGFITICRRKLGEVVRLGKQGA